MDEAEAFSRKNRKPNPSTDKLAYAARLKALERNIGVPIKRHRDPGKIETQDNKVDKDENIKIMKGF